MKENKEMEKDAWILTSMGKIYQRVAMFQL